MYKPNTYPRTYQMHSNSLLSPDSTSPGCPPLVQLIGQIASRLILPVYLFPEHSVDVFITLIKAKSNILSRISRLRNDFSGITNGSS